ncbi:MAG: PilZ domain-containing protein [Fervidobacterium sp.]|jgi:hypothetical protein
MTIEEYINANLTDAVLRGFAKDGQLAIRMKKLKGKNIYISFLKPSYIPEVLRIDLPIEGYIVTFIGKLSKEEDKNTYVYTALEKAGILQRRAKPRYVAFESCVIFDNFKGVITDISENGCQILSEYKPKFNEIINLFVNNNNESGKVMWFVEEEECYRCGIYIENASETWTELYKKYSRIGELL